MIFMGAEVLYMGGGLEISLVNCSVVLPSCKPGRPSGTRSHGLHGSLGEHCSFLVGAIADHVVPHHGLERLRELVHMIGASSPIFFVHYFV